MKPKTEREFRAITKVEWVQVLWAKNKKEALQQVKDTFKDEYNLDVVDKEVELVEVQ